MADLILPRRASYEDYCQFPNDGKRYEILEGEIYMAPAPSPRHQFASKRLQRLLETYFEKRFAYQVFNAPLDVIFANDDVVQPDLVVVADRAQISNRGIEGAPLVVVEILSPGGSASDRQTKARRYAIRNVAHYWIVDPDARTIECFHLEQGAYRLSAAATSNEVLTVAVFSELTIPLASLWLD